MKTSILVRIVHKSCNHNDGIHFYHKEIKDKSNTLVLKLMNKVLAVYGRLWHAWCHAFWCFNSNEK